MFRLGESGVLGDSHFQGLFALIGWLERVSVLTGKKKKKDAISLRVTLVDAIILIPVKSRCILFDLVLSLPLWD